jgi:hypothetical protein
MSDPKRVDVGACRCPGAPHDSDWVDLEPELTLAMASGALFAMRLAGDTASDQMAAISSSYLPSGIRDWAFTNEDESPVPINRDNMERLIPWDKGGSEVVEQADALYSERLMAPLVRRLSISPKRGRTAKRMSPIPLSGHKRRKSSPPSSPDASDTPQSAAQAR